MQLHNQIKPATLMYAKRQAFSPSLHHCKIQAIGAFEV
jgi:hypothetical protein